MNHIAKRDHLPASAFPRLSAELASAVEKRPEYADSEGVGLRLAHHSAPPAPHLAEEARHALEKIDTSPADPRQIEEWLAPIAVSVRNPPGAKMLPTLARAIALACQTIPGAAFNPKTQMRALQEFQFWPAPADVFAIVAEDGRHIMDKVAALRRIAEARHADDAPREKRMSDAERARVKDHMRKQLAALKAEFAASDEKVRPQASPRYVDRATLNILYARAGRVGPQVPT